MGLPSRGFCIYSNRLPENGLGVVLSQLGFGPQFRAGVSSLTGPRASTSHKRSLTVSCWRVDSRAWAPAGPARPDLARRPSGALQAVEVLGSGFHGVDDQFVAVVVDEGYEFEEATGRVDGDHEPAARVVLVIEGA